MSRSDAPPEDSAALRVVLVTAPDAESASRIARALVEERLAACVNLLPGVRSIYRWNGVVQEEAEVMLLAKTRADRVADLVARVRALHSHAVPEAIALPIVEGSEPYLRWVREESAR